MTLYRSPSATTIREKKKKSLNLNFRFSLSDSLPFKIQQQKEEVFKIQQEKERGGTQNPAREKERRRYSKSSKREREKEVLKIQQEREREGGIQNPARAMAAGLRKGRGGGGGGHVRVSGSRQCRMRTMKNFRGENTMERSVVVNGHRENGVFGGVGVRRQRRGRGGGMVVPRRGESVVANGLFGLGVPELVRRSHIKNTHVIYVCMVPNYKTITQCCIMDVRASMY